MYKLQKDGVKRLSDNASIPDNLGNRDWRKYQQWLGEGNTPQPMDVQPEKPDSDKIQLEVLSAFSVPEIVMALVEDQLGEKDKLDAIKIAVEVIKDKYPKDGSGDTYSHSTPIK